MAEISITTNAFGQGERIPEPYTCNGQNISPPLTWEKIPAGTKSIAVIVDDPDAPRGSFTHWLIYNLPPDARGLAEQIPKERHLPDGSIQGMNDFGRIGYAGPCPPPGRHHRFTITVFAIDIMVDPREAETQAAFRKAIQGHTLAKGELMGIYGR
jgi:Raf kinase inhibitor-like YbhB/YbcL family protein